jgi:transcriptional regulator with XRE-family HTH domain
VATTVGQNFRRIRKRKQITQEAIYRALNFKRVSNVSLLETSRRLPTPRTIKKMASALGCEPWELLENVETPHDALRRRPESRPKKRPIAS